MTKALILHIILISAQPYAHTYPHHNFYRTLRSIITVESSLCRNTHNPQNPDAIGCGQVLVSTAAKIAGTPVSRWMLGHDIQLNTSIAAAYLNLCARRYPKSWLHSISCYEQGPNHPIHWRYVDKVRKVYENLHTL